MKTVFKIFKRDVRRIFNNGAAAFILIGICLLPSLYSWFNIYANMDPYGNTENIKIAVANNDQGAETENLSFNAGMEIVEDLKDNDQLGWVFVDEETAVEGVKSGEFYAAITIPEDFSDSLVSILSGELENPKLDYYINEKKNAIAPKITDTGATTVQQEINDTFSSVASQAVTEMISRAAVDFAEDVSKADSRLITEIKAIRSNLAEYQSLLDSLENIVNDSDSLTEDVEDTLELVKKASLSGAESMKKTSSLLSESREALGDFSDSFSQIITSTDWFLSSTASSVSEKLSVFETKVQQASVRIDSGIETVSKINTTNEQILKELEELHNRVGNDSDVSEFIGEQINVLQKQNKSLQELLVSLKKANSAMENAVETSRNTRESLESVINENRDEMREHRLNFEQNLIPEISASLDGLALIAGNLEAHLEGIVPMMDQVSSILEHLRTALDSNLEILSQAGNVLERLDEQLETIHADLNALKSSDTYQDLLSLEVIDSDKISDFVSSPVTITTKTMFDVENYGSGMAPFYTNLALWVGGLILVSVLKLEVDREGLPKNLTLTQSYFGRLFLFISVAVVQGLCICIGDIVLLKVQSVHPVAFVLAGVAASVVYVNIIYALAAAFKHIGKALAVILIILQIPGSSGTYPVEMMPDFFRYLHPLLPFTYGINAMRECISGFYGHEYIKNIVILLVFLVLALLVGVVLRPFLQNLNYLFDKRLMQTDLMICENETADNKKQPIQMMINIIMQDKEAREKFIKRSEKFERKYEYRVKMGFAGVIWIPMVFLILMLYLEEYKLVFLALWIVSLIFIALYLICIEYIHDRISRKTAMNDMTTDDLVKTIKEAKTDEEYMDDL